MNVCLWILLVWGFCSVITFAMLLRARRAARQWEKLENNQASRLNAVMRRHDEYVEHQKIFDEVAREILTLQRENLELKAELDEMRLQAAKYMDLYREEKYKPKRKNT
jgi:biopolymer transport protein ExbB/TolQ